MNINFDDYNQSLKIVKSTMPDIFPVVNQLFETVKDSTDATLDPNNRFYVAKHNGYVYKFNTGYNYLTIVKTAEKPRLFLPYRMVIDDLTVSLVNLKMASKDSKNMILSYLDNENKDLAKKYGNGHTASVRIWLEKINDNYTLTTENYLKNYDSVIKTNQATSLDIGNIFGD